MLILDPTPLARGLVRKKVVVNYTDGRSWHHRGEQAVGRGAGVGEAATGGLRAASASQGYRAAQPHPQALALEVEVPSLCDRNLFSAGTKLPLSIQFLYAQLHGGEGVLHDRSLRLPLGQPR
jgi:hypothetical protein